MKKVFYIILLFIYANGNPLGRIQSTINQSQVKETEEKNPLSVEADFLYWQ